MGGEGEGGEGVRGPICGVRGLGSFRCTRALSPLISWSAVFAPGIAPGVQLLVDEPPTPPPTSVVGIRDLGTQKLLFGITTCSEPLSGEGGLPDPPLPSPPLLEFGPLPTQGTHTEHSAVGPAPGRQTGGGRGPGANGKEDCVGGMGAPRGAGGGRGGTGGWLRLPPDTFEG